MAGCIPYVQWLSANAACRDKGSTFSVKGFGYAATGMRGLGLGDLNINTTPVYNDPSDPCYIASQTPCPAGTGCPATCPTGYHSIDLLSAPGQPAQCACARDKAASPGPLVTYSNPTPGSSGGGPILQANTSATGGFSHWGLLAAVAVGGGALYLVMRKKKAS